MINSGNHRKVEVCAAYPADYNPDFFVNILKSNGLIVESLGR